MNIELYKIPVSDIPGSNPGAGLFLYLGVPQDGNSTFLPGRSGWEYGAPVGAPLTTDNPWAGRLLYPHFPSLIPQSQPHMEHWEQMLAAVENAAFDTCHAQHGPCLPQGCGNRIPQRASTKPMDPERDLWLQTQLTKQTSHF